ncbi:lipopolysaccharide biosynthesis protein [Geodermatophilus sp. SYSU D01036]
MRAEERRLDDVVSDALRGFFGRDSVYMILWGVQLVAAALVTPLMTRALAAPAFGDVVAANAVMQVAFVLAGLGLYTAIQRRYAQSGGRRDPATLLGFSIVASTGVTVCLELTGPLWAVALGFDAYSGPVRVAVLWAGASAVTNSALALLRSQDRLAAFSTVSLLQSVVAEATSLLLVIGVEPTATMFLLGQLGVQVVAMTVALVMTPPRLPRPRDRAMLGRALAFGLPLVPAVLSTFVLNSADRLMVQSELGATAVARYQVAYNVGALPMLLLGVLNTSWMPRIFSFKESHERAAVIAASRDTLYRLLMPVLVGLAAGAPLVLRIWAPPEYEPETLLMVNAVVLASAIPYTAGLSATRTLMAEGRTGYVALAQGIAGTTNVGLNLVLIPLLGLTGSAAATLVSLGVLHLLMIRRAQTLIRVTRPPTGLLVGLLATGAATLLIATVPAGTGIVARAAVVLAALAWFAFVFLARTGVTPARPRPARTQDE